MLWAHQWGHKGGSLEEVMPRADTGGPARQKLKVAFPGGEDMDTGWHLCFARNCEVLWMTGPWLQRCRKVTCSDSSAVCFHQTADGQCLCVYVHVCMRFSHPRLQTHDVRNLAKHPFCKIMEDFTHISKHTFQKIMYHKFQSIYIPVSSPNLGNPQFMSICFFSEQTLTCIILYRSAEIKKAVVAFPRPDKLWTYIPNNQECSPTVRWTFQMSPLHSPYISLMKL